MASLEYLLCENAVWWLVMTKASRAESTSSHSRRPVALLLPLPEKEKEREREREYNHDTVYSPQIYIMHTQRVLHRDRHTLREEPDS